MGLLSLLLCQGEAMQGNHKIIFREEKKKLPVRNYHGVFFMTRKKYEDKF
jgi:hypothetical protein